MFLRSGKHIEKYWKWLIPILGTTKNAEKSYIFVMSNLKENETLVKNSAMDSDFVHLCSSGLL